MTNPSKRDRQRIPGVRSVFRAQRRFRLEVSLLECRALLSGPGDTTAPTTTASIASGTLGDHGVYITPVTIHLTATDPDDASSTLRTFYKVDNASYVMGNDVTLGDGFHTVQFYSEDPANNVETSHSLNVNVDLTAPVVTASASPNTLWPPNHKQVPVTVSGLVTDASGGVPTSVSYRVVDEYGQVQPSGTASVNSDGHYSFVVDLQASRRGQDKSGRLYTIIVTAVDEAGNTGSTRTYVIVPHDQGHPITFPGGGTVPVSGSSPTGSNHHRGHGNNGNSQGQGHGHGNGNDNSKGGHGHGNNKGNPVAVTTPVSPTPNGNSNGNGHGHGNGNDNGNGNGQGNGKHLGNG